MHILRPGHEREDLRRYKEPIELQWDYYGPFGFAAVLSDLGEPVYDMSMKVTANLIMQKEIAIVGTADGVVQKIMRIKEVCGDDDFMFTAWFEAGGYSTEEIEEQMETFAAAVMPVLRRECGGGPTLPQSAVQFAPEHAAAGVGGS